MPGAKAALIDGTGLSEDDIAAAVGAPEGRRGAPMPCSTTATSTAFTIAGNADDCRELAAAYAAAGVTELALTFFGPAAAADMAYIGKAFAREISASHLLQLRHLDRLLPAHALLDEELLDLVRRAADRLRADRAEFLDHVGLASGWRWLRC